MNFYSPFDNHAKTPIATKIELLFFTSLGVLFWLLTGCAGQTSFQHVARITLGQVAEYENEVASKVTAEKDYTKNMVSALNDSADRQAIDSTLVLKQQQIQTFQAQVIKGGGNTQDVEVTNFVNGLVKAVTQNLVDAENLKKQYAVALPASLSAVESASQNLRDVRQDLEQLQTDQSASDQIKNLISFGSEIQKNVQNVAKPTK